MRIVFIGSGNVASVLARRMIVAGHHILQVVSKTEDHARALATECGCAYTSVLDRVDAGAECYIVSVSDHALGEVAAAWPLSGKLLVHTAGAVDTEVLAQTGGAYGCFYPLQSLRKEVNPLAEWPVLVDASDEDALSRLFALARSIGTEPVRANDARRLRLHLGSVVVNNFTNHLYALAEQFSHEEDVDFRLLFPLIQETVRRIDFVSPRQVQTGPAFRRDTGTVNKHLELLRHHDSLRGVYATLTESIDHFYYPDMP